MKPEGRLSMYIEFSVDENGNKIFLLKEFGTKNNYNTILKILLEDFHMELKEEVVGVFTYRASLELTQHQYELIWHVDLGNYIYSICQNVEDVTRLELYLKEAEQKINQMLTQNKLENILDQGGHPVRLSKISEMNYQYFEGFFPEYLKGNNNMTYLGIVLTDIAIGSVMFQKSGSILYLYWLYISPEYRRFHYASHAVKELIQKMEDLKVSQMIALTDKFGEDIDSIAEFFLQIGFTEKITPYDVYSVQIKDLFQKPQIIKLMEKRLSGKIFSLCEIDELPLKHWNNKYFKIEKSPEYENYSFLIMNKGEITGVLLGKQENDKEYLLETLYHSGQDSLQLLDLILKFISTVNENGGETSMMKIVVIDSKMEQLVKKLFGIEIAPERILSYRYEYNVL